MQLTLHYSVVEHPDHVEVIRSSIPFDVGGDLYERSRPMLDMVKRLRHLGLLIDLRSVASGVGPQFESKIKRVRQEMTEEHPRVAILVATALGRLEVSRNLREDEAGSHIRVFSDEKPAREFARDMLDTSPYL